MKKRISKILGVGLTIAVLASLLVAAAPASAAPGTEAYGVTATPSAVGTVLEPSDIDFLVATADGATLFAYDNAGAKLYKSTTSGVTWSESGVTTGFTGLTGKVVVDMAISPKYATDSTIVAAEAGAVWYSANGGVTFASVANADLLTKVVDTAGGTITSVAVGYYYADNTLSIVIGVTGGAGATSNVLKYKAGTWEWTELGNIDAAGIGNFNVVGVAFSPAHISDAQILGVYIDGAGNTVLASRFGTNEWNANIPALTLLAAAATGAVFGFASDYMGTGSNTLLVGTRGTADAVIRVSGVSLGIAGTATALAPTGAVGPDIKSISVSGALATSNVLVGLTTSNVVYRHAAITTATAAAPGFTAATKSPTGALNTTVLWAGTTVYAGTTGVNSAVSKSTDGGVSFNQLGLIDVGLVADMSLVTIEVVDANTMFLIMNNADSGAAGYAVRSLFKTTNAGASWERIRTGTATLGLVKASPKYATDSTIYVAEGAMLYYSANGGATFLTYGVPAAITALLVVDGTTYFTGATAGVYKSGRWAAGSGITAGANVVSIAISPAYATDKTLIVGTDVGSVFQSIDDGVTFTLVGTAAPGAATDTMYVAFDPGYATNKTIYAGSSNAGAAATQGIFRWVSGVNTTTWTLIQGSATHLIRGLIVAKDGTLYATSNTVSDGILRSLDPTSTAATVEKMNNAQAATFLLGAVQLMDLAIEPGKNVLYAIDGTTTTATTLYGYTGRLVGINDILATAPTLVSPKTRTVLTTVTTAAISWTAMTAAASYNTAANSASTFAAATAATMASAGVVAAPTVSDTAGTAGAPLTGGTTYYWRVRAATPVLSRWSTAFTFITALAPPAAPVATMTPAPGATAVSITPSYTWPAVAGATSYDFMIAEDRGKGIDFAIIDYAATSSTIMHVAAEPLKYSTTYYWRVRAVSATSKSDWTVGSFTTMAKPAEPTPPVVIEPTPPAPEKVIEIKTVTVEVPVPQPAPAPVIPDYLLWTIIVIGAVLVIALIVLIVRTRRVS